MKKPNFLLICVDQMRSDCMSWVGERSVETPYLDTLVNHGVAYTNAYSAVPSCIASRAALLTGMSQEHHGRKGYQDGVEWNYCNVLAKGLSEHGYHTQCIGKMHVYPQRSLMGFHNVVLHDGYLQFERNFANEACRHQLHSDDYIQWLKEHCEYASDVMDTGLDCNSWVARPWIYEEKYHPTHWVASQTIDFLRRRDPSKPFFAMASFVRPHSPLDPPEFYYNMYASKQPDRTPIGDWAQENWVCDGKEKPDYNDISGTLSEDNMRRFQSGYYGCITHIDHQIGRMIQALEEYGVLNDTIILFVSDHGDMLGEHRIFRKAMPYEGSVKIPFIISSFGKFAEIPCGKKVDAVVELRDIMPTIYELAQIPVPETCDGGNVLRIREDGSNWREWLHGEHEWDIKSNHYIVTKKDKYIFFPKLGIEQYFDKIQDPHEEHNLIHDKSYADRIQYLRDQLKIEE